MDTYLVRVSGVSLTESALLLSFASSHWICVLSPSLPKDCCWCSSTLISCSPAAAPVLSLCFLAPFSPLPPYSFALYVLAATKWSSSGYIQWRSLFGVLCCAVLPSPQHRSVRFVVWEAVTWSPPSQQGQLHLNCPWLMLLNLCLHTDNDEDSSQGNCI